MASATILPILHGSHEDTSATRVGRAFATETLNLAVVVDLVVAKHGQLDLLPLVLDLLRGGVHLLLALLGASAQPQHQVQRRLLLDIVVAQGSAVLKLLTGKDKPLLVWRDAFLILDLGLDIVDRVGRLDLEGDGFAREGLHEDLHGCDIPPL